MDTRADKKRMCQTNECKDFWFNFKEYIEMENILLTMPDIIKKREPERLPNKSKIRKEQ